VKIDSADPITKSPMISNAVRLSSITEHQCGSGGGIDLEPGDLSPASRTPPGLIGGEAGDEQTALDRPLTRRINVLRGQHHAVLQLGTQGPIALVIGMNRQAPTAGIGRSQHRTAAHTAVALPTVQGRTVFRHPKVEG